MKVVRLLLACGLVALGLVGVVAPQAMAGTVRQNMATIAQGELNKDADSYRVAGSTCNMYSGYFRSGTSCGGHNGWFDVDWCADFVRYVWTKAGGVKDLGKLDSFAQSFENYGRAENNVDGIAHWHNVGDGYVPQPGDAAVYPDWDGNGLDNHVAIVVSNANGVVTTIDGNAGNGAIEKTVNPKGLKGFAVPVLTGGYGGGTAHDMNGDGRDDVVAVTPGSPSGLTLTAYHGGGSVGHPTLSWSGAYSTPSIGLDDAHYAVGDMNHDGKADVVYAAPQSNGTTHFGYWPSSGTAYKPSANLADSSLNSTTAQVFCGDINGDGYTDVVVITPDSVGGTAITAFKGNGSAISWAGTGGSKNLPYATTHFALADYNRDGRSDVVWAGPNPDGTTTLGGFASLGGNFNGSAIFAKTSLNTTTAQLLAGDITGDGNDDIALVTPAKDGSVAITAYAGTGSGFAWSGTGGTLNMQYADARFGMSDADGDGRADVLFTFTPPDGGTQFGAWLSNGKGFGGANFTAKSGLNSVQALFF